MEDSSHGAGNHRGIQTTPSIRSAENTVNLLFRLNAGAKKIFACFDRVGRQGVTTAEPIGLSRVTTRATFRSLCGLGPISLGGISRAQALSSVRLRCVKPRGAFREELFESSGLLPL